MLRLLIFWGLQVQVTIPCFSSSRGDIREESERHRSVGDSIERRTIPDLEWTYGAYRASENLTMLKRGILKGFMLRVLSMLAHLPPP